mmetsp:Transcript_30853/g.59548  ORF Transcript_30853/g.59548 Transcript_30853/m.59548 type:complete len:119 (+) Transcript_30853:34-390(+)
MRVASGITQYIGNVGAVGAASAVMATSGAVLRFEAASHSGDLARLRKFTDVKLTSKEPAVGMVTQRAACTSDFGQGLCSIGTPSREMRCQLVTLTWSEMRHARDIPDSQRNCQYATLT